jgi:DNA modification methylase
MNTLIQGDCIEVMRKMSDASVDLIYLDPPFFSNRNYEVIWGDDNEIRSFVDRWAGGIDHYIAWLKERVVEMHRVLKPTGSIFLHCDWHADAYIRVEILDKVFGKKNFRNEIIWCYKRPSAPKQKQFPRLHDSIFWYSKSKQWTFLDNNIRMPYAESSIARAGYVANASKMTDGGIVELKKGGKTPEDWWDIPMLKGNSKEWIGYPTQKPQALLERIIECASNVGDIVLDPFVGGGTTMVVADKLKRNWIGIDQSVQAVKVTELRLNAQTDLFTNLYANSYTLQLYKYDYDTLRYKDAFEFETWIIGQFGGVANAKKGGDQGIDGKTDTVARFADNRQKDVLNGTPIQVKRSENIGVNVVKNFSVSAKQYDRALFEKNVKAAKPVGYIIAFSFGKGAVQEAARLNNQENIIIELVTVDSIIPVAKRPNISVEVNELSRDEKGVRTIEFAATGNSPAGINLYSWDFAYDVAKGFKPTTFIDKDGKQTHAFEPGHYHIAVKAVDNDGLENVEVIQLKMNGKVETTFNQL